MFVEREEDDDGVVTLTLDDGKYNALDTERFEEIADAFDACADAPAVVVAGRDGAFTAGLNTKLLPELDAEGLRGLIEVFARTWMRVWLEPRPVVAACTGHAIAAGTMLAMACDHAVAADGDFRWGLTETQIGFPLPEFAIALARGNVRVDRLDDLLLPGAVVAPAQAVEVGFADALVEPGEVLASARSRARELADLPRGVYAQTKRRLRGAAAQAALDALEGDIESVLDASDV